MYHDRTAWRCAFFVGKKYGSKGYPHTGNAAHVGSISCMWISYFVTFINFKAQHVDEVQEPNNN
jgi:hypothetical protein